MVPALDWLRFVYSQLPAASDTALPKGSLTRSHTTLLPASVIFSRRAQLIVMHEIQHRHSLGGIDQADQKVIQPQIFLRDRARGVGFFQQMARLIIEELSCHSAGTLLHPLLEAIVEVGPSLWSRSGWHWHCGHCCWP